MQRQFCFFAIFGGVIANILNRTNIVTDPKTQGGTLLKVIAVALLILWTFVNMRINRRAEKNRRRIKEMNETGGTVLPVPLFFLPR